MSICVKSRLPLLSAAISFAPKTLLRTSNMPRESTEIARFTDVVNEVTDQRLNVAVEDQSDEFAVLIDSRRTRITADDVVRRNEVERRVQIDCQSSSPSIAAADCMETVA